MRVRRARSGYIKKEPQPFVRLEYLDETLETVEPFVLSVQQSECERRQTDLYGFQCNLSGVREPESVSNTLANQEWMDAMTAEIDSLHDNGVWDTTRRSKAGREQVDL